MGLLDLFRRRRAPVPAPAATPPVASLTNLALDAPLTRGSVIDVTPGSPLVAGVQIPLALPAQTRGVGDTVMTRIIAGGAGYSAWPGVWSQDRVEQVAHFRAWTYIALRAICKEIQGLVPNVAYVESHQDGARRQMQLMYERRYREARYKKTLGTILPHEEVNPAPDDHPLVNLLRRPNAWDHDGGDLWYELTLFLELTGNGYLWVVPDRLGRPLELWVIPSHWVRPRFDRRGLVYYDIIPIAGAGTVKFPAEEVIHIRYKSPLHKIDGWSPQTAGAEWIDAAESVNRSRFWQFKNGCFPIGNLELDKTYADVTEEELERIYAKFFSRLQGETRYGMPVITPPGAKYSPLMINPVEMAYVESAEQLRDWTLALWGVPKEIVGLQPTGSDLSWYAPQYQFTRFTITPLLRMFAKALTSRICAQYDKRLRIWWDDPTPDNPTQVNADLAIDLQHGIRSINEARGVRGLPPWKSKAADAAWMPQGNAPMPLNEPGDIDDLDIGGGDLELPPDLLGEPKQHQPKVTRCGGEGSGKPGPCPSGRDDDRPADSGAAQPVESQPAGDPLAGRKPSEAIGDMQAWADELVDGNLTPDEADELATGLTDAIRDKLHESLDDFQQYNIANWKQSYADLMDQGGKEIIDDFTAETGKTIDWLVEQADDVQTAMTELGDAVADGDGSLIDAARDRLDDEIDRYKDRAKTVVEELMRQRDDAIHSFHDIYGDLDENHKLDAAQQAATLNGDDYADDPEGAADDARTINEQLAADGNPYRVWLEDGKWVYGEPDEDEDDPADDAKKALQLRVARALAVRCGGEGGKPGPCPTGQHDEPATEKPSGKNDQVRGAMVSGLLGGAKNLARHAKLAARRLGRKVWAKLPAKAQRGLAATWGVAKAAEHVAMKGFAKGKELAIEAARERGLSEKHVETMARIIGVSDQVMAWTVNFPAVTALTGSAAAGKVASFMPVASLAYIGYSAARNPFALARAAKKVAGKKSEGHKSMKITAEHLGDLAAAIDAVDGDEWFLALVSARLDDGDSLGDAVTAAKEAYSANPKPPQVDPDEWPLVDAPETGGKGASLLSEFPDVRQREGYSCGAASLRAVCLHFGVGPTTEDEFMALLGTDPHAGTPVKRIVELASERGLTVESGSITLEALAEATAAGKPVICPVQIEGTGDKEGHYVTALAVTDKSVIVQCPVKGRLRVGKRLWERRWHDVDADGTEYPNWGIVLSLEGNGDG